jgi:2-dehydro-3-deoxyphosphogluconate aldolase/(4S)-4-hydroxy-2-oxoglutarate aldolase
LNKEDVRNRIAEIGIIPSVRVSTADNALFAAEAVSLGGIPIVEVTLTVPDAYHVISQLVQNAPEVIVGAGGVNDVKTARSCLDAGASFLTSDGFDAELVGLAVEESAVVIPGTLTPSEVLRAWKLRPDFVKVVPCAQVGGEDYVHALKAMFPHVPLVAAGGVNQQTASRFILAGAVALGIATALIPREAILRRQPERIAELARRFVGFVSSARGQFHGV